MNIKIPLNWEDLPRWVIDEIKHQLQNYSIEKFGNLDYDIKNHEMKAGYYFEAELYDSSKQSMIYKEEKKNDEA